MQTEDLLKVKFVLVCALASEVESGRHIGIPLEQLMEAIRINPLSSGLLPSVPTNE